MIHFFLLDRYIDLAYGFPGTATAYGKGKGVGTLEAVSILCIGRSTRGYLVMDMRCVLLYKLYMCALVFGCYDSGDFVVVHFRLAWCERVLHTMDL